MHFNLKVVTIFRKASYYMLNPSLGEAAKFPFNRYYLLPSEKLLTYMTYFCFHFALYLKSIYENTCC